MGQLIAAQRPCQLARLWLAATYKAEKRAQLILLSRLDQYQRLKFS